MTKAKKKIKKPDRGNQINKAFTKIFTQGMRSIKPEDGSVPCFNHQILAWRRAFQFPQHLRNYVNDEISNYLVSAGNKNPNTGKVGKKFVNNLMNFLNSLEFEAYMNIAKPEGSLKDPEYVKKLEVWKDAFKFPKKLKNFARALGKAIDVNRGPISMTSYNIHLDRLIKKLNK